MVEAEGLRPLASRTGIPVGQIRSLIDGRAVRVTTLERMTTVLGVRLTIGPGTGGDLSLAPAQHHDFPAADPAAGIPPPAANAGPMEETKPMADQFRDGVGVVRDLAERVAGAAHSLFHLVSGWDPVMDRGALALIPFAPGGRAVTGGAETVGRESSVTVGISRDALPGWSDPGRLVCLRTTDDSMDPKLCRGDLVAVDPERSTPEDGQLFALATGGEVTVRRLRYRDRWILVSDNPAFEDRPLVEDDQILGQVAWHGPHDRDLPSEN